MKSVYTNIDDKTIIKFCSGSDYKVLAHHGVCNALNSIVRSRHMVLVKLLPMILVHTGQDYGKLVEMIDRTDGGD